MPIFVIQKHKATSLHYDFRIASAGVLKSWAVPKGPSLNPAHKRLAMPTPDHTMRYGKFEGVIPEGEYGAGTVMIWDKGTYKNIKRKDGKLVPMSQCLKQGRIEIWLEGEKLRGGFALVRIGSGKEVRWLLIKMNDEHASRRANPVSTKNKSVVSGRTMARITKECA